MNWTHPVIISIWSDSFSSQESVVSVFEEVTFLINHFLQRSCETWQSARCCCFCTCVSHSLREGETVFHSLKTNEICLFLRTPVPGRPEPPLSLKTTDHIVYSSVSLCPWAWLNRFQCFYILWRSHWNCIRHFYRNFIWTIFKFLIYIFLIILPMSPSLTFKLKHPQFIK